MTCKVNVVTIGGIDACLGRFCMDISSESASDASVNCFVEKQLDDCAAVIAGTLKADVMTIRGSIWTGLENAVRDTVELGKSPESKKLAIILDTDGGIIEVVERMVKVIRHHYAEVVMIIPDAAMSAGTVFAMSGDSIMMDYFSCLGPIDPQLRKDGRFVPALSYLVQYERLKNAARAGELTTIEVALAQQLDLAELHRFEEARELSVSLLKEWLAKYKFKNWTKTQARGQEVTTGMRTERAEEIARELMDHQKWHSHGRPICMNVLRNDLKLQIDDLNDIPELNRAVKHYYSFLCDYMAKMNMNCAVHIKGAKGIFNRVG